MFTLAATVQACTATKEGGTGPTSTVSSTAYCLSGTMANGERVHHGAVAMNGVPFGTRYRIVDGSLAGQVFTVKDRIGHGSQFDVWMASCGAAIGYGRQQVRIQQV